MEVHTLSPEEMDALGGSMHVSRVFDPIDLEEPPDDFMVAVRNYELYRTQRGRTCEYPNCTEKLRYTRIVPVCWKHEGTEFAECHPAAEPGSSIRPRLWGLRAARERVGMSTRDLAQICGHTHKWVEQIERGRNGVQDEIRRLIAVVLNVSESELLEGV